ncbi:hypothetical protein CENSYa_1656 [Cenarchaeum symbiosum A]|uniref:Uncharacterized protein n=1 Tax=Cenarchaeum symbiosum (strain A) TaxID=414004 RepID=A0RY57_CENSY|nr:hypothetical protein CENSYa_1656 [Cenarchaeum symbiosum A]
MSENKPEGSTEPEAKAAEGSAEPGSAAEPEAKAADPGSAAKAAEPEGSADPGAKSGSAREAAEIAEKEAKAAAARMEAAREAADAEIESEYQGIAKGLKVDKESETFTDKRSGETIFNRVLGEPEFWLDKGDRVPTVPVLSDEQKAEISRRVEVPTDQTPRYEPKHVLSKEFAGTSNYEMGLGEVREEAEQKLQRLSDSGAGGDAIRRAEEDLRKLDCMYENYHLGMNVFRTAKGGRDRAKK